MIGIAVRVHDRHGDDLGWLYLDGTSPRSR
jgi:hypothetical protein